MLPLASLPKMGCVNRSPQTYVGQEIFRLLGAKHSYNSVEAVTIKNLLRVIINGSELQDAYDLYMSDYIQIMTKLNS